MIFCFCTARNQSCSEWTHSWWTCWWRNLPFHLGLCLMGFPKKPRMMSRVDHEWLSLQRNGTRRLFLRCFQPSLAPAAVEFPSSLHFWMSKEEKLDKRSWRGAWELPSWKVGSWKLVWSSWYLQRSNFCASFPLFNRTKVLPWDTPWGHQNAGDLRASSLREISSGFLYLLEMFKHLDILLGYPTEILQNLALGVSQGHRAHCWWLPQFWDQPSMCIPFPCASTLNLLFPAAPSAVGCQEEEIPCDVNAGIAWLGLGTCVLPARLSGIGGYSEQRLCVPFPHKNSLNPFHQLHKSNLGALHVLR